MNYLYNMVKIRPKSALSFLLVSVLLIRLGFPYEPSKSKSVRDNKIEIIFNPNTGTLETLSFTKEFGFLKNESDNSPWEIEIEAQGTAKKIDVFNAASFSSKGSSDGLELIWSDFAELPEGFSVVVNIDLLPDSAMSAWRIKVKNTPENTIRKVTFPRLSGIMEMGEEELAVPNWMGELIKSPRDYLKSRGSVRWEYPGQMSMQFITLYNSNRSGFYLASNDSLAYSKDFLVSIDSSEKLTLGVDNYPSHEAGSYYELPYAIIIGGMKGDWLTAAQIYKNWAVNQAWCKNSRLANKTVPEWVVNTSYWVWNRGRQDNVLPPALHLNEKLKGGVNVLWHWWHGGSYDDSFPEYFPPRDGDELFKNCVKESEKKGVNSVVYMNALKWGSSTSSYKQEGAERFAVKDISGNPLSHVYNIFTKKALVNMCEATQFWKTKYASLIDTAINQYGVSGIYMDQACLSRRCFDPTHGHPIGGGNYWTTHMADKDSLIRSMFLTDRQPALAGEGVGENWLPHLDMFLALQVSKERYEGINNSETIPLFQSVYHEYGITFGNYSSLLSPPYDEKWPLDHAPEATETLLNPDFNKQFLIEQAKSFVWGMQPMVSNYQPFLDTVRSREINYMERLESVRQSGLIYFLYGSFLRAPQIEVRKEKIPVSKLSIYAGRNEQVTRFEKLFPTLYTSAWSSPKQSVAIAFASIDDEIYPIKLDLKSKDFGLKNNGRIYLIDESGKREIGMYKQGQISVDFDLPPYGIAYLELL